MTIDPKTKRRTPGRPTLQEELEIQNKIKPYYEIGLEADDTASKTGIDEKTVRKYYRIWTEKLLEDYIEDVAERQKVAKVRALRSINPLIHHLRAQLNQITKAKIEHEEAWKRNQNSQRDGKIESYVPHPFLENMLVKLIMSLLDMYERKAAIEAAPTISEEAEKAVFQRMQKGVSEKK